MWPCAAAGFGALSILSFLMPAEAVRDAVKAEIRAVTGLDPVLRGDVTVSLFPTGDGSASTTSASATRAPTAGAHRRARGRAAAFLSVPDRPHRDRRRVAGAPDHQHHLQPRPQLQLVGSHRDAGAHAAAPGAKPTTSFSEIRIENGTIVLRDEAYKIVETLSNVEFALAWPSISKSFAATGRFAWHNEPLDATISFTDFVAALRGERSGLKIRLAGAPLKLAFDGYLSHRPTLKMEGTLAADAASLRETLRWAGQQPLPGGGFGRFALKAQTNVVGGNIGALRRQYRARRQRRRRRAHARHRRTADAAGHARGRRPRSDALRLHRPVADQRRTRLGPPADRGSTASAASTSICGSRRRASTSGMPSSAAPRSPPTCAAAISA